MKICPNCQSNFADDTLQFCLNCGTSLSATSTATFSAPATRKNSNAALVAAILGGFLLAAVAIGAVGFFYFNREQNKNERAVKANENSINSSPNLFNQNRNVRSVEIESKSNQSPSNLRPPTSNLSAPLQLVTSASTVRNSEKGNFYFPSFAVDGNSATAWCEGAPGAGTGEWLKFEFERAATLRQIKIQPGYFKNTEVWSKNNRVAEITLEFSDGSTKKGVRLQNAMQTQTIDVGRVRTSSVKIIVDEYYPGASDSDDTLISEVSFVTEP
jgi:hypothetical protein